MTTEIPIVCTDGDRHRPERLGTLVVRDDGSAYVAPTRQAPSPWPRGSVISAQTEDGETQAADAGLAVIKPSDTFAVEHEGRAGSRFKCPHPGCPLDRPLSQKSLDAIASLLVRQQHLVFDVSLAEGLLALAHRV